MVPGDLEAEVPLRVVRRVDHRRERLALRAEERNVLAEHVDVHALPLRDDTEDVERERHVVSLGHGVHLADEVADDLRLGLAELGELEVRVFDPDDRVAHVVELDLVHPRDHRLLREID